MTRDKRGVNSSETERSIRWLMMIAIRKTKQDSDLLLPEHNRLMIDGVSWQEYEQLLALFDEHSVRLTYDRGKLEIVVITSKHEEWPT